MPHRMLHFKHWLVISGIVSLGLLCLLASTSTGLANRKLVSLSSESISQISAFQDVAGDTDYLDQLSRLRQGPSIDSKVTTLEEAPTNLNVEPQDMTSEKDWLSKQARTTLSSSVETQTVSPMSTELQSGLQDVEYRDQLVRQSHSVSLEATAKSQAKVVTKAQQPQDSIWIARWRLINTLDAQLSPSSYEAVLFSLLLSHYAQGHLEAGWSEVQVWLEVLVKHGLSVRETQKLRAKLEQVYNALSQ